MRATRVFIAIICFVLAVSGVAAQTLGPVALSPQADSLAEIVLNISPDQVVKQPLIQTARIVLLDSSGALLTSYNLATNPITLIPGSGTLSPDVLDDSTLFNAGIVDFLSKNVTYSGRTGAVEVVANNGTIQSQGVLVSFNGYDILGAVDYVGEPITAIYSGLPTTVFVTVQNRGTKTAATDPFIKHYFKSASSGSVKNFFTPHADGKIDTIGILLENTFLDPGEDTLVLELQSEYQFNGNVYPTTDTMEIPITVYTAASFSIIPNSVRPDVVYPGAGFDLSFDVRASDFPGQIDSTAVTVSLTETIDGPPVATIYSGSPAITSFTDSVISYDSLPALVKTVDSVAPGRYYLFFDYRLISGGNVFTVTNPTPDSLIVLAPAEISYVSGTLSPTTIPAENEMPFSFQFQFSSADLPLEVLPDMALFRVYSGSFADTVHILFPSDTLFPGIDSPLTLTTEEIVLPASLIGQNLNASAWFTYRSLDAANSLQFTTNFDSELVSVVELPSAQMVNVRVVAPNRPKVNTDQPFQISAVVANRSNTPISGLDLKMTSDGQSVFDSLITIEHVPANDSVEVLFDVVAGPEPVAEERFRVEITSTNVNRLPPINNVAIANIQTPALLDVTYTASNGAADGLVQYGESFNLVVKLDNLGEAAVTSGNYRFTTGGVDLGLPDTTVGVIDADTTLIFFLTAPQVDTTAYIRFDITQRPLDVNSGLPAAFQDSSFVFVVQIVSGQAELQADASQLSSKLVIPGSEEDLIRLDLKNQAMSPIWDMLMKTVTLDFKDLDGRPLRARSLLEIGNCGLFIDDQKVAAATAGEDKLIFYFDNFDIAASETRSVILRLSFLASLETSFRITMDTGAVEAEFIDTRVHSTPVPIITDSAGAMVINTSFASTGRTLQSSFLIEHNPFDPNRDPARFSYVLSEPSGVELRIFSVTGELVYTQKIPLGADGTSAGEQQFIEWDGRNDDGTIVLNGVYVAQLYVQATDEQAQMKVAVVKR